MDCRASNEARYDVRTECSRNACISITEVKGHALAQ